MAKKRDEILVMIRMFAPQGSADNLVSAIKPILGSIRARNGCLQCCIYQDSQSPEEMALLQAWTDKNAFAAHVGSRDYRYILEWMEMSETKPEITICKNPDYDGIKVIRELLSVAGKPISPTLAPTRTHSGKPS